MVVLCSKTLGILLCHLRVLSTAGAVSGVAAAHQVHTPRSPARRLVLQPASYSENLHTVIAEETQRRVPMKFCASKTATAAAATFGSQLVSQLRKQHTHTKKI